MKNTPIQNQADALWWTLRDPDTRDTLVQALHKLWKLFTQFLLLIGLMGLLVTAGAVWLWGLAFQKGRSYREWLRSQDPPPTNEEFLARLLQDLLAPFKELVEKSGAIVRKLLGIAEPSPDAAAAKSLPAGGQRVDLVSEYQVSTQVDR